MTDHERGAYTPPTGDPPLSFDPRQPVRGARPIPVTLILSVLVLAGLVAAIFVFYRSGVRQAAEAPPVVGEPVGAMRSAATPEAQPQNPAAGLQIYQAEAGGAMATTPAEPTFVQPPEQPLARPTTPVTQTAEALKPAVPAPEPAPPKAAAPVAKPTPPPAKIAAPEPKKAAAPEPKAVTAGGSAVQIGAVSSTALADRAWSEAVAAAPGLAAGKGKSVEKIEKNGGVLYRTAVTGFASRADAQKFCSALQAAGKSCFVR